MWLCRRFVTAKKSGSALMTNQRVSIPIPRVYASKVCSISATPPPVAVELTLRTARWSNTGSVAAASARNSPNRAGPSTSRNRCGGSAGTYTSCSRSI